MLLVVACGAATEPEPEQYAPVPAEGFALSPSSDNPATAGAFGAAVYSWAKRWERATGIPIAVAKEGIPVVLKPDVVFVPEVGQPQLVCGLTTTTLYHTSMLYDTQGIAISNDPPEGCADTAYTIGHEIGHMLTGPNNHHAASGVYSNPLQRGVRYTIDADTLERICTYADCRDFNPE